jgi:crotonobetainyl-CoA:carnitine CoA-transferase CaiB-like acyl-CoA transferase
VTTSLVQAALFVQHRSASLFDATDEWKRALVIRRVAGDDLVDLLKYRADRVAPDLFFMRTYPTRDGAVAVGAIGPMIDTFCRLFGVVDPRQSEAWADRSQRRRLLADAQAAAGERLAAMSSVEAVVLLQEADIPAAPVRFLEEALVDADLFAAGLLYRAEDPALGGYTMPSPPVSFGKARYEAATTVPGHGQHTDVLLAELGYEQDTINRLVADGIVARAVGEDAPAEGEEGG